jgi:hypothetical protein
MTEKIDLTMIKETGGMIKIESDPADSQFCIVRIMSATGRVRAGEYISRAEAESWQRFFIGEGYVIANSNEIQ